MDKLIEDVIDRIKNDPFLFESTKELYLIGNQSNNVKMNDCDLVAFIENSCSIVKYIEQFADFMYDKSLENNLLINVFSYPIKMKFQNSSMFVLNILKHGKRIL